MLKGWKGRAQITLPYASIVGLSGVASAVWKIISWIMGHAWPRIDSCPALATFASATTTRAASGPTATGLRPSRVIGAPLRRAAQR